MKPVAVVQARMGSTRLPGKTMKDLAGKPMLARVVERTLRANRVEEVVVATTELAQDDLIAAYCRERHWPCFRGSEGDVLDRYYRAAKRFRADPVIRITSDCPLIDPELVDRAVTAFADGGYDYASNGLEPRTFPRGLDVEVISRSALNRAWEEDHDPRWREHVTTYIYRHPESFRILRIANEADLSTHRWTVDTMEDYNLISKIYEHFDDHLFGWKDVLRLVGQHQDWSSSNSKVRQKVVP